MCGWHVWEGFLAVQTRTTYIVMQNFLMLHGDLFLHGSNVHAKELLGRSLGCLWRGRATDLSQQNKIKDIRQSVLHAWTYI